MIANRSKLKGKAMRRATPFLLLMAIALPAWSIGQSGQNPPASPPSSSSSKPTNPPQAQPREIATFDPPSADKDVDVASYYMRKGDMNAAIPRLQEAVQLKPKYAKARLLLAEAYEKDHDKDSAVKTYQDYLKTFPNAPDAKKIEKKIEKLSSER
jgi:tetratricopeptide (TPR) repeat protein